MSVMSPKTERRFQAYGVGMNRTGTNTLAGIFANYRSQHQFMRDESDKALEDRAAGRITTAGLKRFLLARDRAGNLELDSAASNGPCVDVLVKAFPEAKFILTLRSFYGWFSSEQNKQLLRARGDRRYPKASPNATVAYKEQESNSHWFYQSEEAFLEHLPNMLGGFVDEWAKANQFVLDHVPADRLLVVKTRELDRSLGALASFTGVPRSTLVKGVHEHKAPHQLGTLTKADPELIEREVRARAGALMDRFFPGFTFKKYLASL